MTNPLPALVLGFAVAATLPSRGLCTLYSSTTPDSAPGAWSSSGSWTPGGVPGGDPADIAYVGTATYPDKGVILSGYDAATIQNLYIAESSTAIAGTLWMGDGGSLVVNNDLYVGGTTASSGLGNLYIGSGASLGVKRRLWVGTRTRGQLTVTGGTLASTNSGAVLQLGYVAGVNGTFNLQGGEVSALSLTKGAGTAAFNWTGGRLNVDAVGFSVTNAGGILAPGSSGGIGTTTLSGDYVQTPDGKLEIQIAGSGSNDRLNVTQAATLESGTRIEVVLLGGYVPPANTAFHIFSAASFSPASRWDIPANWQPNIVSGGLGQTLDLAYLPSNTNFFQAGSARATPGLWTDCTTWRPCVVPSGGTGDSAYIGSFTYPDTGVILTNHNAGTIQTLEISYETGTTNALWIEDGGALSVKQIYVGGSAATAGFGRLHIGPGASLAVTKRFWTGVRTAGRTAQSGGAVNVDASDDGDTYVGWETNGTYTMSGGILAITNDAEALVLGGYAGSQGTLNLEGGVVSVCSLEKGAGGAAFNWTGGTLNADAINLGTTVTNAGGVLNPGKSGVGLTDLNGGGYVQTAAGTLEIQIAGAGSADHLDVQDAATLEPGTRIAVVLLNGYEPPVGTAFNVMTASSIDGDASSWSVEEQWKAEIVAGGNGQILKLTSIGPPGTVVVVR